VAGPQFDEGAVGGGCPGDVQAQAGLDAGDRSVGVDVPLLVGSAVTVRDLHRGTGGGAGPGLVGPAVAVPDLHLGAGGPRSVGHVQAPARTQPVDGGRRGAAAGIGASPGVLEAVQTGLAVDAEGVVGCGALQGGDGAGGVLARPRALGLGGGLDPGPEDGTHALAANRVGDAVKVGDEVGAVACSVVVSAGVHGHAELGEHRAALIAA